jgi:hypothetical protein
MTTRGQVLSVLLLTTGMSGFLSADVAPGCGSKKATGAREVTPPSAAAPADPAKPLAPSP